MAVIYRLLRCPLGECGVSHRASELASLTAAQSFALFVFHLPPHLFFAEETELEGTAALPRTSTGYLSAIVDTLRLVLPERSSSSISSQPQTLRGLQATKRNCLFVNSVSTKLLWALFQCVSMAESTDDKSLVRS